MSPLNLFAEYLVTRLEAASPWSAAYLPRELPFSHAGFGQDDEWVMANFTNATEILAVGYPQWVDAQVGEGLTNGLYKFTATIPGDPPETVQLVVGDLSVAITNAGEYVFFWKRGWTTNNIFSLTRIIP